MLVYSAAQSPRLAYILKFLGRSFFDAPVVHTTDAEVFVSFTGPKLQYGGERLAHTSFYIPSVSLLFEQGIASGTIDIFIPDDLPVFFAGEGSLPFDLFAAIFYLLSRYEEWLPHKKDRYGRFPPEASLAFRHNFLRRPLIDEWLMLFKEKISRIFPEIVFRGRSFSFLPTYDIDMAWCYRNKGIWRNAAGMVRDLLQGHPDLAVRRRAVLLGKVSDPFDSFSWLDELHKKLSLRPKYFFLLAATTGRFDKNVSPRHPAMKTLVTDVAFKYDTGVHPSWQSGDNTHLLQQEIKTISVLAGKKIGNSRQHYLRLTMPVTYRRLVAAGIRNDFSMGYGSANGFRASFTGDFYWYDLEKDEATSLLLTPFCFMDTAACYGESIDAATALNEMRQLQTAIFAVNGRMVTIWHNQFLGSASEFAGWREAYEEFCSRNI